MDGHKHLLTILPSVLFTLKLNVKICKARKTKHLQVL